MKAEVEVEGEEGWGRRGACRLLSRLGPRKCSYEMRRGG
jgi:hypothetical protein